MMPSEEQFIASMKEIDVRSNDQIVVCDNNGMMSSARAFWMFKNFGVDVLLLNGTFAKWLNEKLPIESGD